MGTMGLLGVEYNIIFEFDARHIICHRKCLWNPYACEVLSTSHGSLRRRCVTRGDGFNRADHHWGRADDGRRPLVSFVAMDIEPMRVFGIFTALGIFATLVLSVTLVPAVIYLLKLEAKNASAGSYSAKISIISEKASRHRTKASLMLLALVVFGFIFSSRVQTRMDQRSFFEAGSPPDLADTFFLSKFGGSIYVQVRLTGDFRRASESA